MLRNRITDKLSHLPCVSLLERFALKSRTYHGQATNLVLYGDRYQNASTDDTAFVNSRLVPPSPVGGFTYPWNNAVAFLLLLISTADLFHVVSSSPPIISLPSNDNSQRAGLRLLHQWSARLDGRAVARLGSCTLEKDLRARIDYRWIYHNQRVLPKAQFSNCTRCNRFSERCGVDRERSRARDHEIVQLHETDDWNREHRLGNLTV